MKRRTKIATILTTGLLSAALVGVGFAAWTIKGSEDVQPKGVDATVTVDKVEGTTGVITLNASFTDNDLHFGGKPTEGYNKAEWIDDSTVENDDLTLVLEVTASGVLKTLDISTTEQFTEMADLNVSWSIAVTGEGQFAEMGASHDKLSFEGKQVKLDNGNGLAVTESDKIIITITFSYKNPFKENIKTTDAYAADEDAAFREAMDAIGTWLGESESKTINFTVTAA